MAKFLQANSILEKIPASVLWGSLAGICLGIIFITLQDIWSPILSENSIVAPVYQIQIIILSTLLTVIIGKTIADLSEGKNGPRHHGAVILGSISGICAALWMILVLVTFDLISHPPIVHYSSDPLFIRMLFDRVFQQWLIPLAGFILIFGILSALTAGLAESRYRSAGKPTGPIKGRSFSALVLIAAAVLIIPPGAVLLGIDTGIIKQYSCCDVPDSLDIVRTSPYSIRLVLHLNPDNSSLAHKATPFINISINEKDFTSRPILSDSGLTDTVNPPEGLAYGENSTVMITGPEIRKNESMPVHVVVIESYRNPDRRIIIGDTEL